MIQRIGRERPRELKFAARETVWLCVEPPVVWHDLAEFDESLEQSHVHGPAKGGSAEVVARLRPSQVMKANLSHPIFLLEEKSDAGALPVGHGLGHTQFEFH